MKEIQVPNWLSSHLLLKSFPLSYAGRVYSYYCLCYLGIINATKRLYQEDCIVVCMSMILVGDTEKLNLGKVHWFCIPKNKDVKKSPNLARLEHLQNTLYF